MPINKALCFEFKLNQTNKRAQNKKVHHTNLVKQMRKNWPNESMNSYACTTKHQ